MGGARQDLGTTIELDVARTLEELAVLEAKLKEHLDYKKTMMGAIMRSQAGLEDMAVEDLTTNLLKHAPARSKLQSMSYVIVEFSGERTVAIAAKCWTYEELTEQYCYWPAINQTTREPEHGNKNSWILPPGFQGESGCLDLLQMTLTRH
ncbi:hypothetical protein UPYG_G00258070 [Umbra pygmaea]|uniref:Uncharacterized protein n=1 Tax=Umbra pygmaea TaxID=75934 RepID=A0ABD0W8P7_UMBPY